MTFTKTKECLNQFMLTFFQELEEQTKQAEPVQVVHEDAPDTLGTEEAAAYLNCVPRNLAVFRKYELLRYAKFGKRFVYRRAWLDQFMEEWSGYDLSSEEAVKLAISSKKWRCNHEI